MECLSSNISKSITETSIGAYLAARHDASWEYTENYNEVVFYFLGGNALEFQ